MNRRSIIGLLVLAAAWSAPALSQVKPSAMQTCQLGDLKLESGEVIRDFRMTYITFGTSFTSQKLVPAGCALSPNPTTSPVPFSNPLIVCNGNFILM